MPNYLRSVIASFTNDEYADILGITMDIATLLLLVTNHREPDVSVFSRVYRRIRETGRVHKNKLDVGSPRVYAVDNGEVVLHHFGGDHYHPT